jgi:site-specific DNA recombinase
MRVVALFRVSTEKQANEGASLDAQERSYRSMADKNGWTTVSEFRGCESATQAASERRVLQQVLACVRDNEVDALWVYEQSRLTRGDELETAMLMRELKERRLRICVNGVFRDLNSIDERFMVGIQTLVDRAESERIKERMSRGKKQKALVGKRVCGKPPYGYRNPRPGEPGRGTLHVVPEEASVVRRIFNWRLEAMGDRAIAARLNGLGVPPPRGERWGKSTVSRMLESVAYTGVAASNVWVAKGKSRSFRLDLANPQAILVPGAHEAIIERSVWDAAHAIRKRPCAAEPRLLTGLLFVRGEPFGGDSSRGARYYRGPRGRRDLPWLDAGAADGAVWDAFARLATGEEFVARLVEEAKKPQQMAVTQAEIDYIEGEIQKRQKRLDNLTDMRECGDIDSREFKERSLKVREEVGNLRAQLAQERANIAQVDRTLISRLVKTVQVLLAGQRRLTLEQKRRILRSIVVRVDAEVAATGAALRRDERGRVLGPGGPRWRIDRVGFRLALPGEGSPTRAYTPTGGQLAREVADDLECRVGHSATTSSCSAPPAPARP